MSTVDGISFWASLNDARSILENFAFTDFEGLRPPSTYYDYPFQIWTKDAWLFDGERVGPYGLYFSNGHPMPDTGSSEEFLAVALAAVLGVGSSVRRRPARARSA